MDIVGIAGKVGYIVGCVVTRLPALIQRITHEHLNVQICRCTEEDLLLMSDVFRKQCTAIEIGRDIGIPHCKDLHQPEICWLVIRFGTRRIFLYVTENVVNTLYFSGSDTETGSWLRNDILIYELQPYISDALTHLPSISMKPDDRINR